MTRARVLLDSDTQVLKALDALPDANASQKVLVTAPGMAEFR